MALSTDERHLRLLKKEHKEITKKLERIEAELEDDPIIQICRVREEAHKLLKERKQGKNIDKRMVELAKIEKEQVKRSKTWSLVKLCDKKNECLLELTGINTDIATLEYRMRR